MIENGYGALPDAQRAHMAGEWRLLLYRGLFGFLEEAVTCFDSQQDARARELLGQAHTIVQTLLINLDQDEAPDLCAHLSRVRNWPG